MSPAPPPPSIAPSRRCPPPSPAWSSSPASPCFIASAAASHLTEEGRLFLAEARAVLAQADAAERALADLAGLKRGTLSVMASQTIASYWLPPRLVAFRARHPQVAVKALVGNTAEVAKAVADGTGRDRAGRRRGA